MISVTREHEICAGHRVMGHEGKCKNIHGHNYKFVMTLATDKLDSIGRVIDFSVIKNLLCNWLEKEWDHKMILKLDDPLAYTLLVYYKQPVYRIPLNPTAENLAQYFADDIVPGLLLGTGVSLVEVTVWETSKCYATYKVKDADAARLRNTSGVVGKETQASEEDIRKEQILA